MENDSQPKEAVIAVKLAASEHTILDTAE